MSYENLTCVFRFPPTIVWKGGSGVERDLVKQRVPNVYQTTEPYLFEMYAKGYALKRRERRTSRQC